MSASVSTSQFAEHNHTHFVLCCNSLLCVSSFVDVKQVLPPSRTLQPPLSSPSLLNGAATGAKHNSLADFCLFMNGSTCVNCTFPQNNQFLLPCRSPWDRPRYWRNSVPFFTQVSIISDFIPVIQLCGPCGLRY